METMRLSLPLGWKMQNEKQQLQDLTATTLPRGWAEWAHATDSLIGGFHNLPQPSTVRSVPSPSLNQLSICLG